jgi:hypothetical protein
MTTRSDVASIYTEDPTGRDAGVIVLRQYGDSVVVMVTNGSSAMTQRVWPDDMQAIGEWLIRTARLLRGHTENCVLDDGHTGSCSEPLEIRG